MSSVLKPIKVLQPEKPNVATALFGGDASGILNWNDIKYPHFYKMREEIRSLYWTASEINMSNDVKQFKTLPKPVQEAYLKISGLLATLDGPQTDVAFKIMQFASDPSVKSIMATIADQESEHNHSYPYMLSSVANVQEQIRAFDMGRVDPVLLKRNARIVEVYNEFAVNPTIENLLKVLIYSGLLEGLYFYSGFAFFYNLARNQWMVGSSTMISYINRDELHHSRFMTELFQATLAEHPEFNTPELEDWIYDQFRHSVEMEMEWSRYVLTDVPGIDLVELEGYIKYRANKLLRMFGLEEIYPEHTQNEMKWITAYIDNFDDTKSDFFQTKPRTYAKTSSLNGFDDL